MHLLTVAVILSGLSFPLVVWLVFCAWVIKSNPADATGLINASGRAFPGTLRRRSERADIAEPPMAQTEPETIDSPVAPDSLSAMSQGHVLRGARSPSSLEI